MAQKLCDKYFNLTPIERVSLVGELVHAIQSDSEIFDMAENIIKLAMLKGIYTDVKILPEQQNDNHE